jgi:hypothetical protein
VLESLTLTFDAVEDLVVALDRQLWRHLEEAALFAARMPPS